MERLVVLTGPKRPARQDRSEGHVAALRDVCYAGARCIFDASQSVQREIGRGVEIPYSLHVAHMTSVETCPNVS